MSFHEIPENLYQKAGPPAPGGQVANIRERTSAWVNNWRCPATVEEGETLAAKIEQAVWRETSGGVRVLRVEVDAEGVRLYGKCQTYYTKQKAQRAAMAVPGGGPLTNLIEVT